MAEARKWELCVLCQKETEEQLVCPIANPVASRRVGAYKEIINLVSQFRAIGAAPHPDVELPDEELMQQSRALYLEVLRINVSPMVLCLFFECQTNYCFSCYYYY